MATARRTTTRSVSHVVVNKFHGGISSMPDKVQMPMGMTPMCRNVEWQPDGGFYVRKGVGALVYGAAGKEMPAPGKVVTRFYHYVRDPAVTSQFVSQYICACDDGRILVGLDYGSGPAGQAVGTWSIVQAGGTDIITDGTPSAMMGWDTNLYISLGVASINSLGKGMIKYTGTTAAYLGRAWVNDYAAPTGGNMPPARYMATWAERMFVACEVSDTGVVSGSSIRWSHPGHPEDWAQSDQITVGQAGDIITGIAPMRDMLLIFKRSSCYALLGSGSTNFRVVELSGTIGSTGPWTRDNQGRIVFWDSTLGVCRFDGKAIDNIFLPLGRFLQAGAGGSITRCGAVVTDGDRIYATTDFIDPYGAQEAAIEGIPHRHLRDTPAMEDVPLGPFGRIRPRPTPVASGPFNPGSVTWQELIDGGITWKALAGFRWLNTAVAFYTIVWVYREGAGWTSFSLRNPAAPAITAMGQVRSRLSPTGDVQSNRRVVYCLNNATVPIYLSDRYDDGYDWFQSDPRTPINAFYMTPWLHGGIPAQIKKWKAPRIIQEADEDGVLLIDVYYDFNYDNLRRTLKSQVPLPLSVDSYWVDKPGTIGRAKAVMLRIRAEEARHWGVSSITIPLYPKVLR